MEMELTYIAVHTAEPERTKDFYVKYLDAIVDESRPAGKDGQEAGTSLADSTFGGTVYDLSFEDGMKIRLVPERPVICDTLPSVSFALALISSVPSSISLAMQTRPSYTVCLTFTVGSRKRVNELTDQLIMEGYDVIYEPGFCGVEHYSSSVFDPEGNVIELVAQKTIASNRIEPSGTYQKMSPQRDLSLQKTHVFFIQDQKASIQAEPTFYR